MPDADESKSSEGWDEGADAMGTDRTAPADHYLRPGWFTRNVFNRSVARLTRVGLSIWGSRVLEVRGRSSGKLQRVPVNVLELDGNRYLVSARGEGQWVRNVRAAAGRLDLLVGRRRTHWMATELEGADKTTVLRGYLRKWKVEVGMFFEGVDADSSDEELAAIAPRHPVFQIRPAS
jgi:deazaflavin-dependent oxidoreductase (nitroreductase family)